MDYSLEQEIDEESKTTSSSLIPSLHGHVLQIDELFIEERKKRDFLFENIDQSSLFFVCVLLGRI